MPYYNDTYTDISYRLKDWLQVKGGYVTTLEKDLLNRAQAELCRAADWDQLVKLSSALTVSSNIASLPADCARIIDVFDDSDGDGKPDHYYHQEGDENYGYRLLDAFTKAAGHVQTIKFFNSPSASIYLRYVYFLTDFAATGTEYSFFPGELLLKTAQVIHASEFSDVTASGLDVLLPTQQKLLAEYKVGHLYRNRENYRHIRDTRGVRVFNDDIGLDGSAEIQQNIGRDRDYWGAGE